VIFIDLERRLPTDADLPDNIRWSAEDWKAWIEKSTSLVERLAELDAAGERDERNALIERNSGHWGKLKPWLLHLSHGKCWFTEARDIASHPEVEHFRPKKSARNIKGPERDGYWWLAFDYMNFRIAGNVPNRKKGVWFPIRYGSRRSTYRRRCEGDEVIHFLDPTNAYDVGLIAFDEEGRAIPTPGISRWEHVRARRTIDLLKLSEHQALADERRKVWQRATVLINAFEQARRNAAHSAAEKERARASANDLKRMMAADAELSAVARWCVLLRNDRHLLRLVG
jgi:hypothetical protein